MTSVQERLRQSRTPLDKWTVREQMCLASAVSCSGDQNWMSVSRTMKLVCGSGANGTQRPADWYSQKSCAVQYSNLLENVETPKRKKRISEDNGGGGANESTSVETPTDLVLRKLMDERVLELNYELRQNQEEYAQLYREIKEVQNGVNSEERLMAMWHEMEKEEEAKRIDEMKRENQMREREQHKQELQRNWRTITPTPTATQKTLNEDNPPKVETNNAATVEPTQLENKPRPPVLNIQSEAIAIAQQQQQPQPKTSPLLSSLLKSPTSNTPQVISNTVVTSSARTTAPTITNLLTGGPINNAKQPVVIIKNTEVGQLLTRPISGPPKSETGMVAGVAQNLISPSQSAPTLSLLLEKTNKMSTTAETISATTAAPEQNIGEIAIKVNESTLDNNNDEVPMEIESELAVNLVDSDEPDANEEQQLLEVFENIGNIEMEIDAEFLTAMDEEEPVADLGNYETKEETPATTPTPLTSATTTSISNDDCKDIAIAKLTDFETTTKIASESIVDTNETVEIVADEEKEVEVKETKVEETIEIVEILEENLDKDKAEVISDMNIKMPSNESVKSELMKEATVVEKVVKVETISSDDSNDNIPLATVASTMDVKERQTADIEPNKANENPMVDEKEMKQENGIKIAANDDKNCKDDDDTTTKVDDVSSENKTIHILPTEINESNELDKANIENDEKNPLQKQTENKLEEAELEIKSEEDKDVTVETANIVVVVDDDSSTTPDVEKSINNFENCKPIKVKSVSKYEHKKEKTKEDIEKTSPTTPAGTTTAISGGGVSTSLPGILSIPLTGVVPRAPAIRKLRERDRSESPMVTDDDEQPTFGNAGGSRLRRRGSSTPIMDSIPSSPASVSDRDERELRNASKKSLMQNFIAIQQKHGMNIALLEQSFSESERNKNIAKYGEVCLRPMDFQVLQQNIESNNIRSTLELQRDILLMCQNAVMLYAIGTPQYVAAMQIKKDCRNLNELHGGSSSAIIDNKSCSDKETNKEQQQQQSNREFKTTANNSATANSSSHNLTNTSGNSSSLNTSTSAKSRSGFRKSQRIT